tara:strand:- start:182 stop:1114 length:933 start_codon:yes stop_codon:yes gene_type:complete
MSTSLWDSIDYSLNRTYWLYEKNQSIWRPADYDWDFAGIHRGAIVSVPEYSRRGSNLFVDMKKLVSKFHQTHKGEYVITMSGGIDSELVAETFYQLNIPFRVLIQRLFKGANDYDIMYAIKYCKQRSIPYNLIGLSFDKFVKHIIPDACTYGQFSASYSQIALTNLFNYVKESEIIVFSGHNPDFDPYIGIGWNEDSPNLVKQAIAKNKKFFTFTSLEPIFCHYAANYDPDQPGMKDNEFIYSVYPQLPRRKKLTGWEYVDQYQLFDIIEEVNSYSKTLFTPFISWPRFKDKFDERFPLKKVHQLKNGKV